MGKSTPISRLIRLSCFNRYSTKSLIVTNLRSNLSAIFLKSGKRAIEPSSFKTSIKTPEGAKPAKWAKSMAASVCPVLLKTPSFLAFNGKICPGRPKSSGFVVGFTKDKMVFARSWADIPVVQPCPNKSTETVNGVS